MGPVAGTAYFAINGTQYALRGNVTASLGDVQRESVVGMDGYHGYKEEPRAPFIQVDLGDTTEVDINEVNKLKDVTVTIELINGKTGILRNAVQVNQLELNVGDGMYSVRFEGPKGEWLNE